MHLDVQEFRNFYYRTRLGRVAQRAIREQVLEFWPDVTAQNVVGFGFALPLLRPFLLRARRVIALMPAPQGVMHWPPGLPNVAVLCDENRLPLDTGTVDRLLVLHGLDTSEDPAALLDECWRVLGPGGKALFVVPNRAGLWARGDRTPFGFGRPYSLGQLEALLRRQGLQPERHVAALFAPPSEKKFWLRTGPLWERMGHRLPAARAGGVLIVEARKEIPKPTGALKAQRSRATLGVLEGLPNPEAKPV